VCSLPDTPPNVLSLRNMQSTGSDAGTELSARSSHSTMTQLFAFKDAAEIVLASAKGGLRHSKLSSERLTRRMLVGRPEW